MRPQILKMRWPLRASFPHQQWTLPYADDMMSCRNTVSSLEALDYPSDHFRRSELCRFKVALSLSEVRLSFVDLWFEDTSRLVGSLCSDHPGWAFVLQLFSSYYAPHSRNPFWPMELAETSLYCGYSHGQYSEPITFMSH